MWAPPTLTDCQVLCPSSASVGNRSAGCVASVQERSETAEPTMSSDKPTRDANNADGANGANDTNDVSADARATRRARGRLRAALIFGFVAATIEMAIVLWFAFC